MIKNNAHRKDLGFLGEDFQFRLVKYFIDNHKFFRNINSIVDQNCFTNLNLKFIVTILKEFFEKNDFIPSYNTIEILIREKATNEITTLQILETLSKINECESEAQNEIQELSTKFFKQQNMVKAINQVQKIIQEGDLAKFDSCEEIMKNALNVASSEDLGFNIFEGIEEALMSDFRKPIPTGAKLLDNALEGGIGRGEIGLIIASSGTGKSTFSTAIASHASTYLNDTENYPDGIKVLQIFFEDKEKQVKRKHYGRLTEIEAKDLSKDEYIERVREMLNNHPNKEILKRNLRLKKFYNKTQTVAQIRNYIKTLINSGFNPDMVIIDYFECLEMNHVSSGSGKSEWSVEGETYRALESLSDELNIALWIFTQGTKDAASAQNLDPSKQSGSKVKWDASHIVITLTRTQEDLKNNLICISLPKNRGGIAGYRWDGVELNNGIAIINMDNVVTFDSNDEFMKKQDEILEQNNKNLLKQVQKEKKMNEIMKQIGNFETPQDEKVNF